VNNLSVGCSDTGCHGNVAGAMMTYATYSSSVIAFDQLPVPTDTVELVKKLGEGTYGSVYLAVDKRSGRPFSHSFSNKVDLTRHATASLPVTRQHCFKTLNG